MWEISLWGQAAAFGYSAVLGAILGFVYDIIRATRKAGANSFFAVFAGDILFWVISALAVFLFLMAVANGEIRGYIIFACFLGFLIYFFTVGRIVLSLLSFAFLKAAKAVSKLSGLSARGCVFAEKLVLKAAKGIKDALKRFFSKVKKLLKKVGKVLYTDKNKDVTELDADEQKR